MNISKTVADLHPSTLATLDPAKLPVVGREARLALAFLQRLVVAVPYHHRPPWFQVAPGIFEKREEVAA